MDIAFVLYPNMTALDLIGPYDVLGHIPGVQSHFVAASLEPVRTDAGLQLVPTMTFAVLDKVDVVVVPGSGKPLDVLNEGVVAAWLRGLTATWTTSVCTGSTVLGQAGLLDGLSATTHWAFRDVLADQGVRVSLDRVVREGQVITAAGVSAGLDMALTLVGLLFNDDVAKLVQLSIEYDPEPPYDFGSAEKAPAEFVEQSRAVIRTIASMTSV